MVSNKVKNYQNNTFKGMYAIKERKLEKSDLKQYKDRTGTWKATEASSGDSHEQSGKEQEEIALPLEVKQYYDKYLLGIEPEQEEVKVILNDCDVKLVYRPPVEVPEEVKDLVEDSWIIELWKEVKPKKKVKKAKIS